MMAKDGLQGSTMVHEGGLSGVSRLMVNHSPASHGGISQGVLGMSDPGLRLDVQLGWFPGI